MHLVKPCEKLNVGWYTADLLVLEWPSAKGGKETTGAVQKLELKQLLVFRSWPHKVRRRLWAGNTYFSTLCFRLLDVQQNPPWLVHSARIPFEVHSRAPTTWHVNCRLARYTRAVLHRAKHSPYSKAGSIGSTVMLLQACRWGPVVDCLYFFAPRATLTSDI